MKKYSYTELGMLFGIFIVYWYMLNIVWDFQKQFYKIAIVSQCHKPKSADLPQLIEQVPKRHRRIEIIDRFLTKQKFDVLGGMKR